MPGLFLCVRYIRKPKKRERSAAMRREGPVTTEQISEGMYQVGGAWAQERGCWVLANNILDCYKPLHIEK